jgi:hypothetical protein
MAQAVIQTQAEIVRVFERPFPPPPDTSRADIEAALATLHAKKQEWADLPV